MEDSETNVRAGVVLISHRKAATPEPFGSLEGSPASSFAEQMSAARELLSGHTAVGSIMALHVNSVMYLGREMSVMFLKENE